MADSLDETFPDDPNLPIGEVAEAVQPEPETVEAIVEEAPAPEPIIEQPREQQAIPLATALQWRDEAKAFKRKAEELEANNRPQAQVPDPLDDPEGYATHFERQMEERLTGQRLQMSDVMARQSYGAEAVDVAVNWAAAKAQADPLFAAAYMGEAHPIDWIVRQHKRDGLLSDIGDNVDDWFTREAAKRGYVSQSAPAAVAPVVAAIPQPASPPVKVPRSLATQGSSPSDLRHVATGPLAGVDAVFS